MVLTGENQSAREKPVQCNFPYNKPHLAWRMTEPGHPSSAFPNLLSGQQLHYNFVQKICSLAKEIDVFRRKRRNENTDIQIIRMKKKTHAQLLDTTMTQNKNTWLACNVVIFVHRAKPQSILNTLPT
jgi:hypothetical protein